MHVCYCLFLFMIKGVCGRRHFPLDHLHLIVCHTSYNLHLTRKSAFNWAREDKVVRPRNPFNLLH